MQCINNLKLKIKYLLVALLSLFLINFSSCGQTLDDDCPSDIQCKSDSECVKKHGENFICHDVRINYTGMEYHKIITNKCVEAQVYCTENICETQNIDCGNGTCIIEHGRAVCDCKEDTSYLLYTKYEENKFLLDICLSDYSCESSQDCQDIKSYTSSFLIELPVCSSEGKCVQ